MRPCLLFLLLVFALAGCAQDHGVADPDAGSRSIGDIPFHLASGAARVEGTALGIYLTDQPDACLAITYVPVGRSTVFALRVASRDDGALAAEVVTGRATPGPGQAVGGITVQVGGETTDAAEAVDGTVGWRANADGTTTVTALDVGFQGTTDRLVTGELILAPCG